ncbi:hypothetical protein D7Y13_25000 [Corallococcus praedator]|uniref:Uncharacterized protein n=1 Tax=Corallococcus praedator TaxID=2316724 RepID=A0ABX9QFI6_9BACT|nr:MULTISPECIES: hypothetical protein [Corallococcus]RKH14313.1 hypothetical protein D7X74_20350 [Corallococcus sp. CA047B]RKH36115.1 hypothetical protein D7X75_01555 [Corallococcus sp. CA031C]RKI02314.1 hypothetical protein D7Y13_25000 [Corallococcus praedator]
MTPSTEELIAIARHYWRADDLYDFRIEPSPEFERFEALWNEKLKELDRWRALLNQLRRALPECTVGDYMAASVNGCFGVLVYPPRVEVLHRTQLAWTVVGYLSILAPVYTVHCVRREFQGTHLKDSQVFLKPIPLELQGIAEAIAQRIEADYGATALPLDIAQTPVPLYVHFMKPPRTTLFHALFSSEPENIP